MSMQVEAASGRGAVPALGAHRPRRGPRVEEIALMRHLANGPKSMTSGPIGRCVKRGWCRALVTETVDGARQRTMVRFALTESGRALLAEHWSP